MNSFLTLTGTRSPGVQSGGHRKLCLLTQKRLSRLLKVSPPSGTHNNKPFSLGSSYAVKAATEAMTCGRFFLAEIQYGSQLWESIGVKELLSLEVQCAYFCPCCWGGQRRGAQCLVRNIPGVDRAMACSYCSCQSLRESLEVNEVCPWPEKASCCLVQSLRGRKSRRQPTQLWRF